MTDELKTLKEISHRLKTMQNNGRKVCRYKECTNAPQDKDGYCNCHAAWMEQ